MQLQPTRLTIFATLVMLFGVLGVLPAAFADCGDQFPETEWEMIRQTDLLSVSIVDISIGQGEFFADMAEETARSLETDLGTLEPLDLCVYGPDAGLRSDGIVPEGQTLHSIVFGDNRTVVIDGLQAKFFDESHAFGLAYAALWQMGEAEGRSGYPEPLASAISHWYASRSGGKLDLHHSQMRTAAFFADPSGDGIEPSDWVAEAQSPIYTWNPQFQESPIGDMVQYAVATQGVSVLMDLDAARWAMIERTWQLELREEATDGRSSGNSWMLGLGIIVFFVGMAFVMAKLRRRQKIREAQRWIPKEDRKAREPKPKKSEPDGKVNV